MKDITSKKSWPIFLSSMSYDILQKINYLKCGLVFICIIFLRFHKSPLILVTFNS